MDDPDQSALYRYAMQRKNFSGYVKKLIDRDMVSQRPAPRIIPSQAGGVRIDLRSQ